MNFINIGVQAKTGLDAIGGGGNFDVDRLLTTVYAVVSPVGKILALVGEIALIGAVILGILYWFFLRKVIFYKIPIRMYEIVQGRVMFSHVAHAGWLVNKMGAGQVFRLMKTLMKWRQPLLIKPRLDQFQTTLKGKRYINYVRLGKDVYMPFTFEWNLEDKAAVKIARSLDLDSIKNELTANYIKFREDSFWSKYGNQLIMITFAIVIGIFLFVVAKEFTRTAEILSSGNNAMADAIRDFGRQRIS